VDSSLEAALAEEREKAATYLTRLKYLAADFENYQKRVTKELDLVRQEEREGLLGDLLPLVDELELAVESGQRDAYASAVVAGVQVVLKKTHEFLQSHGVVAIPAQGVRFDPTRHTAVERVVTTAQPEGTVLEEVRRGYLLGEKVLRPTMVKVAATPVAPKPTPVEEIGA
jgi:molecular chaperone GrpE